MLFPFLGFLHFFKLKVFYPPSHFIHFFFWLAMNHAAGRFQELSPEDNDKKEPHLLSLMSSQSSWYCLVL